MMPKKAHTEEQIVSALQRVESGEKVGEVCRGLGISQGTFYVWKKHSAGLGVTELRELRQLRDENGRLKRWWRICRSIGRSCRRSSQRSSEARLRRKWFVGHGEGLCSRRSAITRSGRIFTSVARMERSTLMAARCARRLGEGASNSIACS